MSKLFKAFKGIIKGIDEKNFTVDVIVSTDSIDRDMEKIELSAFKKHLKVYKAHPVLLSSHSYSDLTKQIGIAESIKITKEGILVKFKYFAGEGNAEADWGWKLAEKGVAGYSIGFMAHKFIDNDIESAKKTGLWRTYTEVELLEISQVLIPSNRDAVQGRMAECEGVEKEMCEMAIKSVFKKDEKPAKDDVESKDAVIIEMKEEIDDLNEKFIELGGLVNEAVELMSLNKQSFERDVLAILEKEKSHYSEKLFEQKEKKDDVDGDVKSTNSPTSNELANAVSRGVGVAITPAE